MDQEVDFIVNSLSKSNTFKSLIALLAPFINGNLSFSNIICSNFIEKLTVRGCSPTGKIPNNEFIFQILKLYHSISRDCTCMKLKGMQEVSLQYRVKMASYFGKIRNSKTFKPSLELICAILNYVFLNASCTLDSYRADPFQALKPTNLSVYKLKKKQEKCRRL